MVVVYASALSLGLVVLIVVIIGSTISSSVGSERRDPNRRLGQRGRMAVAGLLGFGMGGMAAEFSPLGIGWQLSLLLALVAAAAAALWARSAAASA